jgi:cell division protein FtsQ
LPGFIGQDGTAAEVTQQYKQFSQQLAALELHVTQIALSPRHAWQLRLSNGMLLELGREDMQQRLARFVEVYPYSLMAMQDKVKYVDLRYRNGFAVGGLVQSGLAKQG